MKINNIKTTPDEFINIKITNIFLLIDKKIHLLQSESLYYIERSKIFLFI